MKLLAVSLLNWLRRNVELSSLLFLGVLVLGLWAFAELASEVLEGETQDLDRSLLLLLRAPGDLSDPIGPPFLEEIGRDLTALGGVVVLALTTFAVAGFFLLRRQYGSMIYLLASVGGGILVSTLAKEAFSRPRPDLVPQGSIVMTTSFPSWALDDGRCRLPYAGRPDSTGTPPAAAQDLRS